jgi:hypothetical protein
MRKLPRLGLARAAAAAALLASACSRGAPSPPSSSEPTSAHEISVRVPGALRIARSLEALTVDFDPAARASVVLAVDAGMVLGTEVHTVVYPIGGAPPANGAELLSSGVAFDDTLVTRNAADGIPAPGKRYAAQADVTVFETDVPPGHMWTPRSGKYKVLWTRTLHQKEE